MLNLAFDQKSHQSIRLSVDFSRVILICGKRGSGKSYTLGVIAEELAHLDRFLIILVDPMGVFWSMGLPVRSPKSEVRSQEPTSITQISDPGPRTSDFKVNILVPGDPAEKYSPPILARMQDFGVLFSRITIQPSALSPQSWCDLFDLSLSEPLGICLYRAVRACQRKAKGGEGKGENGQAKMEDGNPPSLFHSPFSIKDLMREVETDGKAADRTREALVNRLDMATEWGVFADGASSAGLEMSLKPDHVNVLDLSVLDPGLHGLRNLLIALLCRDLFARRIRARREEELGLLEPQRRIWLLIDEAHQFVPTGRASVAKDVLTRWVKEGRQPGLSFVAVSQQPGAIDSDLLSQCDLLVIHKLTSNEDLTAISRLGQSYIQGDLKVYLKRVRQPGEVIIVDDHEERLWMGKVRPREPPHAGGELPLAEQRSERAEERR